MRSEILTKLRHQQMVGVNPGDISGLNTCIYMWISSGRRIDKTLAKYMTITQTISWFNTILAQLQADSTNVGPKKSMSGWKKGSTIDFFLKILKKEGLKLIFFSGTLKRRVWNLYFFQVPWKRGVYTVEPTHHPHIMSTPTPPPRTHTQATTIPGSQSVLG